MNSLLKIKLFCLFLTGAMAFYVGTGGSYMSSQYSTFSIDCGRRTWNRTTTIRFYGNNRLLYDSSSRGLPTGISSTSGNRTVSLRISSFTGGLQNLYCSIKGINSQNAITVPYVGQPYLGHPSKWAFNQNHALSCSGFIAPKVPLTTEFYFNNRIAASIQNGFVHSYNIPNLILNARSNNSITIRPTTNSTNGTFYCLHRFNMAGTDLKTIQSTNNWRTNGSGTLASQILLVISSVLTALFASYR